MALSIQIPGADFSHTVASLSLPDRSGLIGEYIFGENYTKSRKNRAGPSALDLTVMNTSGAGVSYGENYAAVSHVPGQNFGFGTGIATPENATLITVFRVLSGCQPFITTGGYNGFHNYGQFPNLYNSGSGTLKANLPAVTSSKYVFYAGQMPGGDKATIWGAAAGALVSNTDAANGGPLPRSTTSLEIGTTTAGNAGTGTGRVAYTAIFNRVLTNAQIAAAYASLKTFLTGRGLEME